MKRRATKEDILLAVQHFITRNGIRAVRVDEVAQSVGISKRTLYELFEDKNGLVSSCLTAMSRQQRQRIAACRTRRGGNPLRSTFRLVHEYIEGLFAVERSFLSDIRQGIVFAEHYDEHRRFWRKELVRNLESAHDDGYLLPEIDLRALADQLLGTLFELRLNRAAREELLLFCRTMLRGAATRKGIELIDSRPPQQSQQS
ncbi:MAG: TetR/AcrR family transcriptional regulator [Alistipes sp.]|nr:TetR/AcrR family transcriptional regulator [Alistipes senegalensis]MCM1250478.1 TetR/AcrR family transcriptional regulator [Alistipes sp.]